MEKFGIMLGIAWLSLVSCKRSAPPPVPPPEAAVAATGKSTPATGKTGLEVVVQPASGITILLDGEKVAEASPYTTSTVTPGPHALEVRGMGFYPILLPITVQSGATLQVPVALRARSPGTFEGTVATGVPEPRSVAKAAPQPAAAPTEDAPPGGAPGTYPELPHGMAAIDVTVTAQPEAPITVDGHVTDGYRVRLHHLKGLITVGALALPYEIWPGSVLELPIPMDGASWFKDDQQLKAATLIKFSHGTVRLRRVTREGEQNILIRRID